MFIRKICLLELMVVQKKTQDEIMKAISEIGTGATITEIEKRVRFERHTLSKYLSFMENLGLLYHNDVGKAKLWFLNKAPIQTVLNVDSGKTFAEKVLSNILSTMPNGLVVIDKSYTILFMNKEMKKIYGGSEHTTFYETVLGKDNPLRLKKIGKIIDGQSTVEEMQIKDKLGNVLQIKASQLLNPDDSFSVLLIIDDITKQKQAEEAVHAQKTLLEGERQALNSSAIVAETDLDGKMTYVNNKFCEISGYTREELIGKTHNIINSGHHPKKFFKDLWTTISSGKVWKGVIKNKSKKGEYYWVDSAIAPVLGKNGKPVKYIAIRFDNSRYLKK